MNPAELGADPDEWRRFADEPLPGWGCRSMTLFDAAPDEYNFVPSGCHASPSHASSSCTVCAT